jgi:hypothetical protein
MPGTDFMERERRRGWSKRDDGAVRGRNSAHKPALKDQTMSSEIDDLPWDKHRLPGLRPSALTGDLTVNHFDVVLQERITFVVPVGSEWVPDMHRRRRGWLETGDGIFDPRMTPVGTEPPAQPSEGHKPGVAWELWNQQYGLCEMITNSTITRSAILAFWEDYKAQPEAARGLLPVVRFSEPITVKMGKNNPRLFYAPNPSIVGWVERDTIAAFRDRPMTVALPSASPEQLTYTPVAPQIAPPARRSGRAPAPVRDTTRDDINDAIPF